VGRLVLEQLSVLPLVVDRLELEVAELGTDPGATPPERFQRRRTRLRSLSVKIPASAIEERVGQVRRQLAALGVTQLSARLNDGFVSVRARAADGLAAADLSFRIQLVHAGTHLRALASVIRVHGHLPSPGPVVADRILSALLGATDTAGVVERPRVRGLCDAEIDLISGLLWHLMPPSGWRLPAVSNIELVAIKIHRSAIEIAYGPPGTRGGDLGVRPQAHQLAAAHDLMHSVDAQVRDGHLEEAMRGYRALLAAGGPDQPLLLERILALASARPAWFFDGLELARQALGRWPSFAPAHNALASITLAQGDAREAAGHLTQIAQLASADGDDDQAALAALAGARLLRVLEPKSATQLYQLALEHDPGSAEAADSLADRLADEQRWPELVRLVRARAVSSGDPARAVALRLRLADVFVHQLGDPGSAQQELAAARLLAPEDPAVHEMTATILATIDPPRAIEAWREVARLAEARSDHRTCARAWAILGDLQAGPGGGGDDAEAAWRRAIELDPIQADALGGLSRAASQRGDHPLAAELLERMRGIGLPQQLAARYELMLARSYLALDRADDARGSLRRATLAGGETAAEAHAVLAEIAEATFDREHAAAELDTAISSLVDLASDDHLGESDRLYKRAAQLAVSRASLFDRSGQYALASEDYQRAHALAQQHAPELARDAAKTMLSRAGEDANTERRWIDAVLATRPPPVERATLLVRRADVRRKERSPDLAAALADLHEALQLTEDDQDADAVATRRLAYQLEAELLSKSGDARARAQALSALAKMAERASDRVERETAAAAAWLAADEPAAALPHGARALTSMSAGEHATEVPAALRREVLLTLGEAAWRQRAWPDVIRAYRGLIDDSGADAERIGTFRYRLAVAADRTGDPALAVATLGPLVHDTENASKSTTPELRGQALRLFADLAERSGDLGGAAIALEGFAALAVESSPTSRADAMYRAGELFRRAGRDEDAIRCLEAALRISDSHLPALDALEAAWRERGDLERVSVILGRKVAATARHPARQKPLLSRLGDLQEQLGRPDVALATHQRALEIDPSWRPSLRYVTVRLRDAGQVVAAAGGLAQLAGELPNDQGVDLAIVARERQIAAIALAELVSSIDDAQLDAIRQVAKPALERLHLDAPRNRDPDQSSFAITAAAIESLDHALSRLRGEGPASRRSGQREATGKTEEDTASGRKSAMTGSALSLRDAAARARAANKLDEALATLETANHVSPGDQNLLRELVELAQQTGDHEAAARHLASFAQLATGARKGDALLELADLYFDSLDDVQRGRQAMKEAAAAFGTSKRRDTTLRMLATEAASNLAWDIAASALEAIAAPKRTQSDLKSLAHALSRAGRDADAITLLEDPAIAAKLADNGELLAHLKTEAERKAAIDLGRTDPEIEIPAHAIEEAAADNAKTDPRTKTLGGTGPARPPSTPSPSSRPMTGEYRTRPPSGEHRAKPGSGEQRVTGEHAIARIKLVSNTPEPIDTHVAEVPLPPPGNAPSVVIKGTQAETNFVVALAAASADRDRLLAARKEHPEDAAVLLALLAHLGDREPALRHDVLDQAARDGKGRALAIARHELALLARETRATTRAAALWLKAFEADPTYAPVWIYLAEIQVTEGDIVSARELYDQVAASDEYDPARRAFAAERAEALSRDPSRVSGEITPPAQAALARAIRLADSEDWAGAIAEAEKAAELDPTGSAALLLLERLYLENGDVTSASEAIGRQLVSVEDPAKRAILWRRRARLYRDTLGRDAEAYRCLKEAHACAPADPEIAYQLRTAAMVRGEWALAASLLYREIAAAANPRDRGALHLELALIYEERLEDEAQAQVNYEQALAFDPTIPAAKLPLARRYEAIGRHVEAAKLYEEAAATARAADRSSILELATRAQAAASAPAPDLAAQLERAEAATDTAAALELAHQLWRAEPGHPIAFRVLAAQHRAAADLPALTELTSVRASQAASAEDRATLWLEVARVAEQIDAFDQAARAYDLALIEDPGHVRALDARGALAFRLSDWATADLIYRDLGAGESTLGDDELALRRSIISEKLGRDTEALAHARTAAGLAPTRRDIVMRVQDLATRTHDLDTALAAARNVLDLIPLEDDDAQLATHFALVDLLRQAGNVDAAIAQLERVLRDHPHHATALEQLAELSITRADWTAATRYLYQLIPLAPSPTARAERLFRLGETVLVHLGDVDRADDAFLRASDLDPAHVPTLRRLLDVYWRADDPAALVEVATELASKDQLAARGTSAAQHGSSLAHALIAAALVGETTLAKQIGNALGDDGPRRIAEALAELAGRDGRLQLQSASTAIAELGRRGLLDLSKLRAAAQGTPVASVLG
jgi:tetratricopeptide (TPR) repeat protein